MKHTNAKSAIIEINLTEIFLKLMIYTTTTTKKKLH